MINKINKIKMGQKKNILEIFKSGIYEFVEISVKQHHDILLAQLPGVKQSGFTTIPSCFECDKSNLKPRHFDYGCPSSKFCLCKYKHGNKRACPNYVCDFICEGITEDHMKLSPNFKTTVISQWTQNYWEIAKCYMEHSSESAETTDILDLLHLIANNRFLIHKILENTTDNSSEQLQKQLDKIIKICQRIKHSATSFTSDDLKHMCLILSQLGGQNTLRAKAKLEEELQNIKENDSGLNIKLAEMPQSMSKEDFLKSPENHFNDCWSEAKIDFESADDSIQLDFIQRVSILNDPEKVIHTDHIPRHILKETTMAQEILNENKNNTGSLVFYNSNNEKDLFFHNILRLKSQCNQIKEFTNLLILSELYAKKLNVSILELCTSTYNALESGNDFLVIVDTSSELIESYLQQFENCKKRHTFVHLISMTKLLKYRNQDRQIILLGGIKELIINASERVCLSKNPESIKRCLHRCFRKIKGQTLETITFKNLVFDEQLTKIKVPAGYGLKVIKLKGSKMIPVANFEQLELKNVSFKNSEVKTLCENVRGMKSLVISGNEKHIFESLKLLTSFWYYCPTLEMIETAECTIGQNKLFRVKIEKNEIDECCENIFFKHSSSCTINELTCMVHHVINRQMISKFTRDDFENSKGKAEKQFIMDAICCSLLQRHDSYVSVYPAKYKGEGETTLVCLTKENNQNVVLETLPDLEQRREYVGFKTEEKNAYSFSAANLSCPQELFDDQLKKYYVNHFDYINEVIAFHAERLLNEHKNLISVSVSLGKVKNEYVDVTLGPHIVLYVNAKSYIPIFENAFPEELKHNNYINIVYPVDVREGYFISTADSVSNRRAQDKLTKLAMGCSVGAENGKTGGTMGPLVEYKTSNNETFMGFLTACHLFRKPEDAYRALNTIVVQPSDIDEPVDINTGKIRQTPNKKCGQIVACRYSEYVDAALVRIDERHPTATNFITPTRDDLNNAGFSLNDNFGLPKYQHGRSLHKSQLTIESGNANKRIVKFGKVTGLRRGNLMLDQTAVRLRNDTLHGLCPSSLPLKVEFSHELKQQMVVSSSPENSFFQKGDSGCGVFLADNKNDLWCIGVGIGMISDSITIVTPIDKIIEELQSCLGISEIGLKSFEAEEMIA